MASLPWYHGHMTTCSVLDCPRAPRYRGLCAKHYNRSRLSGELPLLDRDPVKRFWNNVNKNGPVPSYRPDLGPCWLWTVALTHGYGRMRFGGRMRQAHCISYELLVGEIPPGKELDHLCRVRSCVNPAHLEPVTSRTNLLRGQGASARNAVKTFCDNGHEFTAANTYRWHGQRSCRKCRQDITESRVRPSPPLPLTVTLTCNWCSGEFTFTRGRGGGTPTACSPNCRLELNRKAARECAARKRHGEAVPTVTASCDVCGKQFTYKPRAGKQPTACSNKCRAERQRRYMRDYQERR